MKIISFVNDKGGCGKTTLSTNVAVALRRMGLKVRFVDLDPQQSSQEWINDRERLGIDPGLFYVRTSEEELRAGYDPEVLISNIRKALAGEDIVILDTPLASSNEWVYGVAERLDYIFIPVTPSLHDLRSAMNTWKIALKKGIPHKFIINRAKPRTRMLAKITDALEATGELAPTRVGDRVVLAETSENGKSVYDAAQAGAALEEIDALALYIRETLK